MPISISGQKVKLTETKEVNISSAMVLEHENQHFIGMSEQEEHLSFIRDPNCLHLSIIDLVKDEFSGFVILNDIQSSHRSIELKRIVVNAKGKGFGREALQLCKQLCFEQLNAHSLWLDVFDDNTKAINLYESEHFVLEGKRRECFLEKSGFRSQRFYSILETEYQSIR